MTDTPKLVDRVTAFIARFVPEGQMVDATDALMEICIQFADERDAVSK